MFQILYKGIRSGSTSPTEFNWWRQQALTFQEVSAYDFPILNWTASRSRSRSPRCMSTRTSSVSAAPARCRAAHSPPPPICPYSQNTRAIRRLRLSSMMNVLPCAIDSTGHACWPL
jgi:hypothetical protein